MRERTDRRAKRSSNSGQKWNAEGVSRIVCVSRE